MKCEFPFRAFTAVNISDGLREGLTAVQDELRETGAHVGWVKPGNLHLTLVFFGDIDRERFAGICGAMDCVASSTRSFECEVRGLGFFGRTKSPKIIWAGIGNGSSAVTELYAKFNRMLSASGVHVKSEDFVPHLTIGRVRSSRNAENLVEAVTGSSDLMLGRFEVSGFHLYRSELQDSGPAYSAVYSSGFSPDDQVE